MKKEPSNKPLIIMTLVAIIVCWFIWHQNNSKKKEFDEAWEHGYTTVEAYSEAKKKGFKNKQDEVAISTDFGVKCTYDNYGVFDYVIGVAKENTIYAAIGGPKGGKAYGSIKSNESYTFTTNNGVRETHWRLDRKTAILTSKTVSFSYESTPRNCLTLDDNERLTVLNNIKYQELEEEKEIKREQLDAQKKANDYANKKPQF